MQSKNICFGAVALAFMTSADPQSAALQAIQISAPASQQAISPLGNAAPQNAPDEATRSNPDPALQRFGREFDRNSDGFVAPTMKIDISGSGISVPKCLAEAKEGKGCE